MQQAVTIQIDATDHDDRERAITVLEAAFPTAFRLPGGYREPQIAVTTEALRRLARQIASEAPHADEQPDELARLRGLADYIRDHYADPHVGHEAFRVTAYEIAMHAIGATPPETSVLDDVMPQTAEGGNHDAE